MFAKLEKWVEQIARDVFWKDIQAVRFSSQWESHPNIATVLDDGATLPDRAHETDAGADLCCTEDVVIQPGDSVLVNTGVHVELPHGTVGMLKSKSGLNCMRAATTTGVIDEGYTGPIKVRVYNHGSYPLEFKAGEEITQLVVLPVLYPTYVEVGEIKGGPRGSNGFGSTSVRS